MAINLAEVKKAICTKGLTQEIAVQIAQERSRIDSAMKMLVEEGKQLQTLEGFVAEAVLSSKYEGVTVNTKTRQTLALQ